MVGSELLIQEADPHINKLALGARMSDKMVQINKLKKTKKTMFYTKSKKNKLIFFIEAYSNKSLLDPNFL